jgi:hypothetical protein
VDKSADFAKSKKMHTQCSDVYIYRPFLTISSSNDDVLIDRVLMIAEESLIT